MKKLIFTIALTLTHFLTSSAFAQTTRPLWVVTTVEPTEAILVAEQQPNFFTIAGWESTGRYFRANDVTPNPAVSTDFTLPNLIWAEYVQYTESGIPNRWGYIIYSRDGDVINSLWPEYRPLTYFRTNRS